MSNKDQKTADGGNAVWGAEAIGRIINRSVEQVRYLHRTGALGDAVKKAGHRSLVGDRRKLQQFPNTDDNAA